MEDLINDQEIVVTMTAAGYIKAVPATAFRTQGRGGRGVQGARLKEEDLVTHVVHTSRTRTCCSSPTAAASTGCAATRSRPRSAPPGAPPLVNLLPARRPGRPSGPSSRPATSRPTTTCCSRPSRAR